LCRNILRVVRLHDGSRHGAGKVTRYCLVHHSLLRLGDLQVMVRLMIENGKLQLTGRAQWQLLQLDKLTRLLDKLTRLLDKLTSLLDELTSLRLLLDNRRDAELREGAERLTRCDAGLREHRLKLLMLDANRLLKRDGHAGGLQKILFLDDRSRRCSDSRLLRQDKVGRLLTC
jgi:hypothetical protein